MKGLFALSALIAALAVPARADDFVWPALDGAEAREEIAMVRRAMDHAYPGFGRFTSRRAFEAALDGLAADPPADGRAMFADLAGALAVLQDSHLKLTPNADWEWHAGEDALLAPWRCDIRDGRLFAAAVAPEAQAAGLAAGDEILSVDGVPATEMVAETRAIVAQDGEDDRAREAQLCGYGEAGSALDLYAPFLFPADAAQTLEVRAPDGGAREVVVERLSLTEAESIFGPRWLGRATDGEGDLLYVPLAGSSAAYLHIGAFATGAEEARSIAGVFEDLFVRGADTLILDLRGNAGGSTLNALILLRYLSDEPVRMVSLALASAPDLSPIADIVRADDPRLLDPDAGLFAPFGGRGWRAAGPQFDGMLAEHRPLQPTFRGRLFVLTDPLTASTAALIAARLKSTGRATLIGERPGGSAQGPVGGMYAYLRLPHSGHTLRIPLLRQYAQPSDHPELGAEPDVEVRPALDDLAAGRDPVLTRALELAGQAQIAAAGDPPRPPAMALEPFFED